MKGTASNGNGFTNSLVTGIPDGIMVVFVVITGLCVASVNNNILLLTAVAAIIVGAVTMGISAYNTSNEERGYFTGDLKIKELKERRFLANLGIGEDIQQMATKEIEKDHAKWSGLMQSAPDADAAVKSGLAMALGYAIGGVVPLLPLLYQTNPLTALTRSAVLAFIALIVSGYIKGRYTGAIVSAVILRLLIMTVLASGCIYAAVHLILQNKDI